MNGEKSMEIKLLYVTIYSWTVWMAHEKKRKNENSNCVFIYILSDSRTSAWDPEQRLLQVFGCFCSYLSTVEHRVSNLKAAMHSI